MLAQVYGPSVYVDSHLVLFILATYNATWEHCILIMWPLTSCFLLIHDDVIKWKHFPRYWPFVRGIHRSPVNSPHKGQWRGALMFSFICAWLNGWANTRKAGGVRGHLTIYDVIVMSIHLLYRLFRLKWLDKQFENNTLIFLLRINFHKKLFRRMQDQSHSMIFVYDKWKMKKKDIK